MTLKVVGSKRGGLAGVNFSDPHAPPVARKKQQLRVFLTVPTEAPVNLHGGFFLHRSSRPPDAPFIGGVKFRI